MEFVDAIPSVSDGLHEWTAGPYTIVILLYTYGQHRVQVWHKRAYCKIPDVVPPNF